jgi:oligopeptidase B
VPPQPPKAKRVPVAVPRQTGAVIDDYAWLRDRDDPDTVAYLEAENAYSDSWLEPLAGLREDVFQEIKRRTQETDLSVPVEKGPWRYYTRTEEGRAYPIHCRAARPDGPEQVLLDENAEADGHDFFALGAFDVSPDHTRLAWSLDAAGAEEFTMRVRDLATGADLPDTIERTYYGSAWSVDGRHLFYVKPDAALRPYQVWRHELGTPTADDVLVFQEDDERFFVEVELTRSERYIVIAVDSKTTSDASVIPASEPTAAPRPITPRTPGHEYRIDHRGDRFVILTNLDAEDFRVVTAPVDDPGVANWTELVPHEPGQRITAVEAFAGHIVLYEWSAGMERLRILFDDGTERVPAFDEPVYSVEPGHNAEYDTTRFRFDYESLVTPASVYEEDVRSGERRLLKQTPVLGGFDPKDYDTARTWATAADGVRVPVDIVWRRGVERDGTAPLVLYGYGSYEASMPPWFSVARLSLLDRGVVWALAHPRGGGELGRQWYLHGKLLEKRNTFTDLVACAEHLVTEGWAAPGKVAIRGGSAGGLLVGAAMEMRPDLFAAVVAEVPFVDVVNTMHDETLPLTVTEWEEWGDPRQPEFEAYMASYSPYENVAAVPYPALLVTAGLNDPRVSYHEPAKWVARLRAVSTGDAPLLLHTELGAGHRGPSGRYDAWREEARSLAFLLHTLGVDGAVS